jgi:small subunit ribosomal protein S18
MAVRGSRNKQDRSGEDDKQFGRRRVPLRRKVCRFCADKSLGIDYKDTRVLTQFITERGKIIPSRISGNCSRHQRRLTMALKRARNVALLPFSQSRI